MKGCAAAEGEPRPKLLGLLASHLHSRPRPLDKQRQHLRKLCAAMRATLVLPWGEGLEALEGALHQDPVALRAFAPAPLEAALLQALQAHCLCTWDILHTFGLNHFGRLLHFPAPQAEGGAGGEPQQLQQRQVAAQQAAPAAWEDTSDPLAHDWAQVECMLLHSIWHTDCLPSHGEHARNPEALALMMHVLDCVRALR